MRRVALVGAAAARRARSGLRDSAPFSAASSAVASTGGELGETRRMNYVGAVNDAGFGVGNDAITLGKYTFEIG